jgi:hypothetical protein
VMGKRKEATGEKKDKFFFWDVNKYLIPELKVYNSEEEMKKAFDTHVDLKYRDLKDEQSAILVTPMMLGSIKDKKHRHDLGHRANRDTTGPSANSSTMGRA